MISELELKPAVLEKFQKYSGLGNSSYRRKRISTILPSSAGQQCQIDCRLFLTKRYRCTPCSPSRSWDCGNKNLATLASCHQVMTRLKNWQMQMKYLSIPGFFGVTRENQICTFTWRLWYYRFYHCCRRLDLYEKLYRRWWYLCSPPRYYPPTTLGFPELPTVVEVNMVILAFMTKLFFLPTEENSSG